MKSYTDSAPVAGAPSFTSLAASFIRRFWTGNLRLQANLAMMAIVATTALLSASLGTPGAIAGAVLGWFLSKRVIRSVWLP